MLSFSTSVLLGGKLSGDLSRSVRGDTVAFENVVDLTLDFGTARTLYALLGRFVVKGEVAEFSLSGKKSSDNHRDSTGNELGKTSKHDELCRSSGRKTGSESKRNGQTVGKTDNAIARKVRVDQSAFVGSNDIAAADKGWVVLLGSGRGALVVRAESRGGGRGSAAAAVLRCGLVVGIVGIGCGCRPEKRSGLGLVGFVGSLTEAPEEVLEEEAVPQAQLAHLDAPVFFAVEQGMLTRSEDTKKNRGCMRESSRMNASELQVFICSGSRRAA